MQNILFCSTSQRFIYIKVKYKEHVVYSKSLRRRDRLIGRARICKTRQLCQHFSRKFSAQKRLYIKDTLNIKDAFERRIHV